MITRRSCDSEMKLRLASNGCAFVTLRSRSPATRTFRRIDSDDEGNITKSEPDASRGERGGAILASGYLSYVLPRWPRRSPLTVDELQRRFTGVIMAATGKEEY